MSVLTSAADGNPDLPAGGAVLAGVARQTIEALLCLVMAVVLFRAFEVEGYMISTGSMAPNLLGFHKRVVCPNCRYQFPFGVSFDELSEQESAGENGSHDSSEPALARAGSVSQDAAHAEQLACCPNCGQVSIDATEIPRNQGDQLLVNKSAYEIQNPHRWEVVVFRNPYKATQAYVKRVAGLPGERVRIIDGDVYADGKICRKPLDSQRAVRIPVFDNDFVPDHDPHWRPHWLPDSCPVPWQADGHAFIIDRTADGKDESPDDAAGDFVDVKHDSGSGRDENSSSGVGFAGVSKESPWAWTTYHHWVRSGGAHRTTVTLAAEEGNAEFRIPDAVLSPVQYDAGKRQLSCVGALSRKRCDELLAANAGSAARSAVNELFRVSHLSPVTDVYGYNRTDGGVSPQAVRDLMFAAEVLVAGGSGAFVVEMTDGRQTFDCVFDLLQREIRLHVDGDPHAVRTAPLATEMLARPTPMEMSLFDRQVIVTLQGEPLFEPLLLEDEDGAAAEASRRPVRFGARGVRARVQSIQLFRDVHYTRGRARNGIDTEYALGPDEYFMLGDNSPVSSDSRSWPDGAVSAHLLLGKPFVVHLPSRPGKIQLGGKVNHIRIPDFARMRYIR